MSRRTAKLLGVSLLFLLVFVAGFELLARYLVVTGAYSLQTECVDFPTDDTALTKKIQDHPGVLAHTVHVLREDDLLLISFMQVSSQRDPPFPDLEAYARDLDYDISDNGFYNQPDHE